MRQPEENKARPAQLAAGAGWCETFGEFTDWLQEAGVSAEGLPTWHGQAPVRVVAMPAGRLYLERISRREYRQFRRMVARGEERLRVVPLSNVAEMHAVTVTDFDPAKMKAWKVNNDRCN